MEPAGMVHALERIHASLEPDGSLIDIHPSGEPPPIEVRVGQQMAVIGWMKETDDFSEYAQASAALSEAIGRGWFEIERKGTFEFATCADSISDLREYLAKEWKDAILEEAVMDEAMELLNALERDKELMVREQIRIAQLRPGDGHGSV
jgi:hypothetical protein